MDKHIGHLSSEDFFVQGVPVFVTSVEHNGRVFTHDHSFYELVYVKDGFAMHSTDGENLILTSGDIFLIHPGQPHAYFGAFHATVYNCLFDPEQIPFLDDFSSLPGFGLSAGNEKMQKLSLDINERQSVLRYIEKMLWESENKPVGWEIKMMALLAELLVNCSRIYASRGSFKNENPYVHYVYRALEFIGENYKSDCQIKDIAESIGISPDYLARLFRQVIGVSPVEYLKTYRISVAMDKLKDPNETVRNISDSLGFADMSHFSRQFRQVTGKTPSSFRKENL